MQERQAVRSLIYGNIGGHTQFRRTGGNGPRLGMSSVKRTYVGQKADWGYVYREREVGNCFWILIGA